MKQEFCVLSLLLQGFLFSWWKSAEKAEIWNPISDSEERAKLNNATAVRQARTRSDSLEAKHLDIASKRNFFSLPRSDINKYLSHSIWAESSTACICMSNEK